MTFRFVINNTMIIKYVIQGPSHYAKRIAIYSLNPQVSALLGGSFQAHLIVRINGEDRVRDATERMRFLYGEHCLMYSAEIFFWLLQFFSSVKKLDQISVEMSNVFVTETGFTLGSDFFQRQIYGFRVASSPDQSLSVFTFLIIYCYYNYNKVAAKNIL